MDYVQAARSQSPIRGEGERERDRLTEGDREEYIYIYMNIVRETDRQTDKKNSGENECERKEKNEHTVGCENKLSLI